MTAEHSSENSTENPTTPATPDDIDTIAALVKSAGIGLLTTIDAEGRLVSRPLAVQTTDFDGELWFFTQDPSPKVEDIRANPGVNVAFEAKKGYLSVAGTASIVHDAEKVAQLWHPGVSAWFPEGQDDPTIALIKVVAETAELWTVEDPKPVVLLKAAVAAVRGGRPDVGENKTVTFD